MVKEPKKSVENLPSASGTDELLTLDYAAEYLCVSKPTLYRLLDQGKVKGMKAGRQWRFRKDDLDGYLERGPAALAFASVPMAVLDVELDFVAEELSRAEDALPDPAEDALEGEAGKIEMLIRRLLRLIVARKASDLHITPIWDEGVESVQLRLRIDGVLHEIRRFPMTLHQPSVRQFKAMAGLNVNERLAHQGNRIFIRFGNGQCMFRVSVVMTLYGEAVSIRIIPWKIPTMQNLGLDTTPMHDWVRQQHGLILVTGLTGSGKTTSLVSMLKERVHPDINIMTAESDVVEYIIPGTTQLPAVEGSTQAQRLRALFWHDPDIIYTGELSGDVEVAQLTARLAETGHLVMATMHSHSAVFSLYRLLDWGVERWMIARNLIGIALQALVRKPCPHCAVPAEPITVELCNRAAAGGYTVPDDARFVRAVGCEACRGIGYQGRMVMHEFFTFTPATRAAFLNGASQEEMQRLAIEGGMRTLFAEGLAHAAAGRTTVEEVLRLIPRD